MHRITWRSTGLHRGKKLCSWNKLSVYLCASLYNSISKPFFTSFNLMVKSCLILITLCFQLSCQTKPKQEAKTEQTETAPVDLTKRPADSAPRSAADRRVRALYFEHSKTENPFRDAENRSLIDDFFNTSTADRIWNDSRRVNGTWKRTALSPLFNEPDTEVKKTWVLPALISGDKAIVFVTYQKEGLEKEMRVEMISIGNDRWRISDIVYANGSRLTELLR